MKATKQIAGLSIVALTLIGGGAAAQTVSGDQGVAAGKTREQVRAELVAAQKAGEIPVGFAAVTKRDLDPSYGAAMPVGQSGDKSQAMPAAAGKTREQVRAELVAAQNAGEMPVGFVAVAKRDLNPDRYGAPTAAPQYARAHSERSQVTQ